MSFLNAVLALFLSIISAFNIFSGPTQSNSPITREKFTFLQYPDEAVGVLTSMGITEREYTSRADADGDDLYVNAQGYQDTTGIVQSPYFTISVEDLVIPTYATTVFVGETQKGALHSFSEVYVDKDSNFSLKFELVPHKFFIESVQVFSNTAKMDLQRTSNIYQGTITELGTYTFVFNENDQEHGFTLFVRDLVDENKEIADLKAKYGENNVIVVEKGFHTDAPCYDFTGEHDKIYYLKRGSYLLAKHTYDINSDNDNYNNTSKQDTEALNAGHIPMGFNRIPYLNFTACSNIKLLGSGLIDLSHLDRGERRGIVIAYANNIEVQGIKFINAPEWTFITYDSENITIKDVDIFGYRQNSDAFAICNTRNATIENSFCRSGDDLFDVKTLGGEERAISKNITFSNCTAWNGKARCFGICGEVNKTIQDVTFRDSTVVFHDATWNADRISALAIIVEEGGGSISNVTFENIDIHRADGRAIGCLIYNESSVENFKISGVKYKNIRYKSALPNKISANNKSSNSVSVEFEDVYSKGYKITTVDSTNFETDKYTTVTVK